MAMPILVSTSLTASWWRPGQRRRGGAVARTGGCDEFGGVHPVFVTGRHLPARGFLDVVAPFTLAQPVARAGRARRGCAVGRGRGAGSAHHNTGVRQRWSRSPMNPAKPARKTPRSRLHRHQRPALRVPVQPAQGRPRPLIGDRGIDQRARHRGRDRPIALDAPPACVPAQQRLIRHHQVAPPPVRAPRRAGRSPAPPACRPSPARVNGHRRWCRRRASAPHTPPPPGRPAAARSHRSWCPAPAGWSPCGPPRPSPPGPPPPAHPAGAAISLAAAAIRASPIPSSLLTSAHSSASKHPPILDGQAGRLPHDQRRAPLRERPALQRGQGVRHLVHQRLGQPQVPAAARRGIPPRQRHLAGHPAAPLPRRHPGRRLIGSPPLIQRRGRPRLTRRRGRLEPLQPGDLLDQRRLIGMRIHRQ